MARLFASPGPHTQDGETVATSVIEAVWLERLQAGSTDAGFSWLAIEPGAAEGTTGMIAVVSGYGDGAYPAWWGMDGQDRPVALLTDFGVLF